MKILASTNPSGDRRPQLNIWDVLARSDRAGRAGYRCVLRIPVHQPHQPDQPAQAAHPHAVPVPHGNHHAHPARSHVDADLHQRHGYADPRADHHARSLLPRLISLVPPTRTPTLLPPTKTPKAPYSVTVSAIESTIIYPDLACNWTGIGRHGRGCQRRPRSLSAPCDSPAASTANPSTR